MKLPSTERIAPHTGQSCAFKYQAFNYINLTVFSIITQTYTYIYIYAKIHTNSYSSKDAHTKTRSDQRASQEACCLAFAPRRSFFDFRPVTRVIVIAPIPNLHCRPHSKKKQGRPESVAENSERYQYEDLIARKVLIEIYDDT